MQWADIVNGLFEFVAGFFLFLSCRQLYKDKKVKGWSLSTQTFFTSWAYWNCFYYPHLGQWMSFIGGFAVMATNTAWTAMAIYYERKRVCRSWKKAIKSLTKLRSMVKVKLLS